MSLRTYRHSVCTNLVCVASRHFHANQRQPVKFSFPARPTSGRNHGQGLRLLELDIADVKTQKYRRDQMTTCTSTVPEGRDGSMRCTHTENVGRRRQAVGTRQARCLITGFENSIAQTPVIRPRCSTPPRLLISILFFIIPTFHRWLSRSRNTRDDTRVTSIQERRKSSNPSNPARFSPFVLDVPIPRSWVNCNSPP